MRENARMRGAQGSIVWIPDPIFWIQNGCGYHACDGCWCCWLPGTVSWGWPYLSNIAPLCAFPSLGYISLQYIRSQLWVDCCSINIIYHYKSYTILLQAISHCNMLCHNYKLTYFLSKYYNLAYWHIHNCLAYSVHKERKSWNSNKASFTLQWQCPRFILSVSCRSRGGTGTLR